MPTGTSVHYVSAATGAAGHRPLPLPAPPHLMAFTPRRYGSHPPVPPSAGAAYPRLCEVKSAHSLRRTATL